MGSQSTPSMEQMLQALKAATAKLEAAEKKSHEPIAIIGMGCRFPGAASPAAFWKLLEGGRDAITEIPSERWEQSTYYNPDPDAESGMYVERMATIEHVDQFDPQFFGISPREAKTMDPQQRLLLEVCWEALEHAGQVPAKLRNSDTGVFVGMDSNDYAFLCAEQGLLDSEQYALLGNLNSVAVGRIAYTLGLQGPTFEIDTACSSSLVALHLACQSLRSGESSMALVGGVFLILSPDQTLGMCRMKALSPSNLCRTFDAGADGYVRGEGCGIVVLKRLSDALQDEDNILSIIRGSAVNHDGPSSNLTAPNQRAQEQLIKQALKNARLQPNDVSYIEAHGTGTSLGDPIELDALSTVFGARTKPLWVGSVKTNIGHLEAAAGVAGLLKLVLSMQHGAIPKHLNFQTPNPLVDWENSPAQVTTKQMAWPTDRRIAGVSSFGFSGTNAHVIVEQWSVATPEYPNHSSQQSGRQNDGYVQGETASQETVSNPLQLVTLSAKNAQALRALATRYQTFLGENPSAALENIAYTTNCKRSHFSHRATILARSTEELQNLLAAVATGETKTGLQQRHTPEHYHRPKIAFLFTGQGSQYIGMGRNLYETQPTFRETMDKCNEILYPLLGTSIIKILYPPTVEGEEAALNLSQKLDSTQYTQPALFALEYALATLWHSWGIEPDFVMGHSVGEYVAACVAGVFSLEDGLKLIAARGRLMNTLPQNGAMLAIATTAEEVQPLIMSAADSIAIAAYNAPQSIVLSGEAQRVAKLETQLNKQGIKTHRLTVSHAFHSPLMQPILSEFAAVAESIAYAQPQIPLISNVTGQEIGDEPITADYFVKHISQPVRFAESVTTLQRLQANVFLEIGPKPVLLGLTRLCLDEEENSLHPLLLPSLRPIDAHVNSDWATLLTSVSELYVHGAQIDWNAVSGDGPKQQIDLPTYPFQRDRYWIDVRKQQAPIDRVLHPLLHRMTRSPLVKETIFETQFSVNDLPFLNDHRVFDQVVAPGSSFLSMALNAAKLAFGGEQHRLEEVVFHQPLVLADDEIRRVQLVLTPQPSQSHHENRVAWKLISMDLNQSAATVCTHATGLLSINTNVPQPSLSVKDIQTRCTQAIDGAVLFERLARRQIVLGPSYAWTNTVWLGDQEAISQFRMVANTAEAGDDSLFEFALQQTLATHLHDEQAKTSVPFAVESLQAYAATDLRAGWCYVRQNDGQQWDMQLLNRAGEVVVAIKGYEEREISSTGFIQQKSQLQQLYNISWLLQPLKQQTTSTELRSWPLDEHCPWLIFADQSGIGTALAKKLQRHHEAVVVVFPGDRFVQQPAGIYTMNPDNRDDYARLFSALPSRLRVIDLWNLDHQPIESNAEPVALSTNLCSGSLHLIQALTTGEVEPANLWLVTHNAQAVDADDGVAGFMGAHLWGLGKVAALEHPELNPVLVDLDTRAVDAVESIWDELSALLLSPVRHDSQVAWRNGQRYTARLTRYKPKQMDAQQRLPIHRDCTYLITGGLGGLGLCIAEWLVAQGAQQLLLLGRSAPSSHVLERVEALEQLGVHVTMAQVDVTAYQQVANLLATVRTEQRLGGIVHAAGLLDDGILQHQTAERFAKVMAPKIEGAWNLHQLTRADALDFFVLFSSSSSLLGAAGQSSYSAANACLDSFAAYRRGLGLPCLSINWGPWRDIGMTARLGLIEQVTANGELPISPQEGVDLFGRLLGESMAQVGVLSMNWPNYLRSLAQVPSLLSHFADSQPIEHRDKPTLLQTIQAADADSREQYIEQYLREQISRVLSFSAPEELDLHQRWTAFGFDSLTTIELINRIRRDLKIKLSMTQLFEAESINTLTPLIRNALELSNLIADPIVAEDDESALEEFIL